MVMGAAWADDTPGLLTLPSGTRVRGRAQKMALGDLPSPTFGVYLAGRAPPPTDWPSRWIRWPDFWLPTDLAAAAGVLREVLTASRTERVELACRGGVGRTGTGLAGLCVLDGLSPSGAVAHVRSQYCRRAVEMPWQRSFLKELSRRRT